MFQLTRKVEYALIILHHLVKTRYDADFAPRTTKYLPKSLPKQTSKPITPLYQQSTPSAAPIATSSAPASAGEQKTLLTAKAIAAQYGIPSMHLAKTLQILCQKGILSSKKGVHGGYYLTQPLHNLSLYQLICAVEGQFGIVRCTVSTKETNCNYSPFCNIITPMHRLNAKLIHFYQTTMVEELLTFSNS